MINFKPYSVRSKLTFAVGSFFVLFIIGFLILNRFFLEDFYIYKLESGMNTYGKMIQTSEYLNEDQAMSSNQDLLGLLRELDGSTGYRYEIIDANSNVLLSSVQEFNVHARFEFPHNLESYLNKALADIESLGSDYVVFNGPDGEQGVVMLIMNLTEGHYVVITEQLDQIQGNVAIADEFFLIVGMVLTVLWVIITYLLSKKITDPIIRISRQAKEIAAFDFTTLYDGPSQDEIGQLGQYMNHISAELEGRIAELNTMNLRLQNDMTLQRRFLASISHEFKSPVGIIKGYAESIKLNYYKNETEKNKLVDRILDSSDQMAALVEDIIMLSTLDKREFKLHKEAINLSEILNEVCLNKRDHASHKHISLELDIQGDLIYLGDPMRMRQIFSNLLDNGFRYTTDPWRFKVTMHQEDAAIHLSFVNDCPPIDGRDLEQIFAPFYRFERSHNKKTGGHGLGLSIVKALVEAHDGSVEATYQGHEFTIDLVLST